jgi:D-alanyl-D-alanine carboxypeptidase/D-alanyl-D-alanine-endopeptidase (penicillin-binding protein 4)
LGRSLKAISIGVAVLVAAAAVALGVSRFAGRRASAGPVAAHTGLAAVEGTSSSSAGVKAPTTPASSPAPPSTTSSVLPTTSTTTSAATAALTASLDAALAGTNSCLEVTNGTTPLFLHQTATPFIPASTQKLFVAAAALHLLGPDYRFVTQVLAPALPVAGRVDSLWLRGGGDALLATPEYIAYQSSRPRVSGYPWTPLSALADAVIGAGITTVAGGIRGDDTRYEQLRYLPVWPVLYREDQEVGALSALSLNEGVQSWKPISKLSTDPPAFAANELARLLVAKHVGVGVTGADQATPATAVAVAQVSSAPLSQIVEAMLRASDNLIAELLVREIDRHSGGTGTTAGGVAIVMQQAAALGLPTAGAVIQDGSGLSRGDQATCPELLAALQLGGEPGFEAIAAGLAVAGQTGTLAARFVGSPLAGKLRAKTGSLANAGGMVGILNLLRFAFLINQPLNDAQLLAKEDAVVAALATYPPTAG